MFPSAVQEGFCQELLALHAGVITESISTCGSGHMMRSTAMNEIFFLHVGRTEAKLQRAVPSEGVEDASSSNVTDTTGGRKAYL